MDKFKAVEAIVLKYGEIVQGGNPAFGTHSNDTVLELIELLRPEIRHRTDVPVDKKEYNNRYYETVTKIKRKVQQK